jgi:hypothetical protein
MNIARASARSVALAAILFSLGCNKDDTEPNGPSATSTITVDASANWAYVRFDGNTASTVSVTNPQTSADWHMALFGTNLMLNGGAAGPGNVSGYCLCLNQTATNGEVQAMTATTELADFESVTAADIPAAASFQSDVLVPVVAGWYTGTGAAATARSDSSWLIAKGDGASRIVGKFRVTGISGATVTAPGSVTFEYAIQPSPGAAFGSLQTKTVSVGSTPVYFDLAAGAVSTSSAWDVEFNGFDIRLNSGVSGTGAVRGLSAGNTTFSTIDATFAASPPPTAFRTDAFGGVFVQKKWYRYNITGTDNQIWPTFNVYLIAVGSSVYKVQLISYYNTAGTSRQITLRYARLR